MSARRAAGLVLGLACGLWLASPATALACPVCFSANEANREAFLGTTIFLSLLPLLFVGGVIWVLRARMLDAAGGEILAEPEGPHAREAGNSPTTSASDELIGHEAAQTAQPDLP